MQCVIIGCELTFCPILMIIACQDVPEYMQYSLEEGAKVYARMGQYLEDYANGVKGTVMRFKAY